MVGGGHVRMRADHEARAAVTVMAHRLLLAGRLGMDVDDDGVGGIPERAGGKLALQRGEGVVERVHEQAAHDVDDEDAGAVARLDERRAAAGRAGGKIDRTQQLRRALNEDQRLLLVPGMIAAGHRVGAGIDELLVDRLGDAEAAGRVFTVDGDEVELPVPHQPRQPLQHCRTPAAADHVADEEKPHASRRPQVDDLMLG